MKELSIHISDADVNGFSYWMTSNSVLLFKRKSRPEESLSSVIRRECITPEITLKVIWNSRKSVLVPSALFRLEDMEGYMEYVTSAVCRPQCIQCGEFITVWDVDERIKELDEVCGQTGIPAIHTHERVEQIAETEDDTLKAALVGNLLYISEKENGQLKNSFVAEAQGPEDALYYIKSVHDGKRRITVSLPKQWTELVSRYIKVDTLQ